jgi:hypothetical protein
MVEIGETHYPLSQEELKW